MSSEMHDAAGNPIHPRPASAFTQGSKTTTAGTAAALATTTPCRGVLVTAKVANTGYVYVGDSNVSSSAYVRRLSAGSGMWIPVDDPAKVYIDVSVSAEGVDFGYLSV